MGDRGCVMVFAGPSLPARPGAGWRELLGRVELRPPARRGDVLRVLPRRPRVVVLLDGVYFRVPSVSHKELLYALADGVRVIGAASMGALRAAELARFGMEPVGEVAARYLDGRLEGDDEVALLHTESAPHRPLTEALVEVRLALEELVAEGETGAPEATEIVGSLANRPFWERTRAETLRVATSVAGPALSRCLGERLQGRSVKERDARLALERALAPAPRAATVPADWATGYLEGYLEESLRVPIRGPAGIPSLREAWSLARLLHPDVLRFVAGERSRFVRAALARDLGRRPDPDRVETRVEERTRRDTERFGRPLLPQLEYRRAIELDLLAADGLRSDPGSGATLWLGSRLVEAPGEPLADVRPFAEDLAPAAWLTRSFALTEAIEPAAEAASAAAELAVAHERLRGPIASVDLLGLLRELWGVSEEAIGTVARERGFASVEEAIEAARGVLVAERLPRALNDYPTLRSRLLETRLEAALSEGVPRIA